MEVFRQDDPQPLPQPAMGYVSVTLPGVVRGPHEHRSQTDVFCFPGPGRFELWLWDNRPGAKQGKKPVVLEGGRGTPLVVVVPPGVVHGYRNVSDEEGLVLNLPDALYRGWNRTAEVDEVRHEDMPGTPFRVGLQT